MKKIIFNGEYFASQNNPTGIPRFTFEILRELDKIVAFGLAEIIAPKCSCETKEYKNILFKKIGYWKLNRNARLDHYLARIWKYCIFPFWSRNWTNRTITVNTGLTWKLFNFDVISIYDCTHELFPQYIPAEAIDWYNALTENQRKNIRVCKLIITDSNCAAKDIVKLYGVSENKIKVIPCGWQHFLRIKENYSIIEHLGLKEKNYFFSLGSRFPHKNIKWITFAAQKHPQYKFVVTGSTLGRKDLSFEGDIPENMIFTGYLSDEEVKSLMRHCKAFIQPSFYEGFGIPPMEAMSVGADCIVSNAGALPEVYKNSVWYIDPYDYDNIDLDEIMSRPKESNELILNEYSWEKSAKLLLDVLTEVLE